MSYLCVRDSGVRLRAERPGGSLSRDGAVGIRLREAGDEHGSDPMKIAKLKKLLKAGEWNDVEFKAARADVPKSAFETVSAFANTHGGHLVFGIAQQGDGYEITGVDRPDKVQNDFLVVLHADAKINHDAQVTEQRLDVDDKTILVFGGPSRGPRDPAPLADGCAGVLSFRGEDEQGTDGHRWI